MSYYINEIAVFFKCDKIVAVCDFYFSVTNESSAWDVFRHWPVGLSGGRGILTELSLCYSIVYYYNGALRPVLTGRSTVSGFDLAGFSSAPLFQSVFVVLYEYYFFAYILFLLTSFSLPFSELSLVGLPLDVVD